jgi:hypothetical protein
MLEFIEVPSQGSSPARECSHAAREHVIHSAPHSILVEDLLYRAVNKSLARRSLTGISAISFKP